MIDVYIVSQGDMTLEKMELLSELWRHKIRAEADFGTNIGDLEKNGAKARFLVIFK